MGFDGLRVVAFESRRAKEIAELVRRHGGEPLSAPSMREVPRGEQGAAVGFARDLREGMIDVVVFLTGVGTRFLVGVVESEMPRSDLAGALAAVTTVARGPKPVAALRELGLTPTITVPEPNTWRELLAAIDARVDVRGKRVAVQEYGEENPELVSGLRDRGADVLRVPVYRWALPDDVRPLREAIRRILEGDVDVALFTSATQVEHLFRVAGESVPLAASLSRMMVASIGPVCTEALRRHGVAVDLEPEHPKMGHLVAAAARDARRLLEAKRRGGPP
ncbi:MAG: uroporphyrinogen-III synthase [Candidatus Binatia bacterium]